MVFALFNLISKAKETVAEFLHRREINIEQLFYHKLKIVDLFLHKVIKNGSTIVSLTLIEFGIITLIFWMQTRLSRNGFNQCWAAILKNVSFKAIQIHNF